MKWHYSYKTPDNVTHEDSVVASSKDEAYAILKKSGRNPIRVVPDPRSLFWRRFAVGAPLLLTAAVAVGCALWLVVRPDKVEPLPAKYVALSERAQELVQTTLAAVAADEANGPRLIANAQGRLKDLFRVEYPKLAEESEQVRLKAQALYGRCMMILADEREFCRERAE